MATMNVSLPDKLKAWVESKVEAGDYASASDVVRDLVRRRMDREARLEALRDAIREGEASGISETSWKDFLAEIKARPAKKAVNG